MNTNCVICFTDFEDKKSKCSDSTCTEAMCNDCMIRYIDISCTENRNLVCPRDSCTGVYDQKSLSILDMEHFQKYKTLIYNHFKTSKNTEVEKIEKAQEIHRLMKEERAKFFVESMPATVLKVANIAFTRKLKKVSKTQVKRETENDNRVSRVCFNLFCKGFITSDMTCTKCATLFCKDCEEPKREGHLCKKEVLESLHLIKNMVECPKCKVKVEKIDGCDAITCAVCNTNFWYTTGEEGEAGNHGKFVQVVMRSYNISSMYSSRLSRSLFSKIKNIEKSLEEKNIEEDTLVGMIVRIQKGLESDDAFSTMYSKMVRKKESDKINSKKLSIIESLLKDDKVDELEKLFSEEDRPVLQMRVIRTSGKMLFVDKPEEHYDLERASISTKISTRLIASAIESGEIVGNSYWEFKST